MTFGNNHERKNTSSLTTIGAKFRNLSFNLILISILSQIPNGTVCFLTFSFIIEGASKKVPQFLMPLEPIYNKNFCFNEQNVYYEHWHKV